MADRAQPTSANVLPFRRPAYPYQRQLVGHRRTGRHAKAIVDRLYKEVSVIMNAEDTKKTFDSQGGSDLMDSAEFGKFFEAEIAKWKKSSTQPTSKWNSGHGMRPAHNRLLSWHRKESPARRMDGEHPFSVTFEDSRKASIRVSIWLSEKLRSSTMSASIMSVGSLSLPDDPLDVVLPEGVGFAAPVRVHDDPSTAYLSAISITCLAISSTPI